MDINTEINTANTSVNISAFIEGYVRSSVHSWSIGIPGAIAEFMYDDDEYVDIKVDNTQISVTTARGAMQIDIPPGIKCVAYEKVSPCMKSWSQAVAFCMPESTALCKRHEVLTESGNDNNAIYSSSRQQALFDMGVGSSFLQFCIRSNDNDLVKILRNNCGRSIFEPGNPASQAILDASPTRVVISALGRIEVNGKIPVDSSELPVAPHTHLLPALLKSTNCPGTHVPAGFIEALTLYPEHPVFDKYGRDKAFKQSAYDDFQRLLSEHGSGEYCHEKSRAYKEILQNTGAGQLKTYAGPSQRLAWRIAELQAPFIKH